ncbi:LON peptidase substrate-binding domain-containing protein [Acidisphaera sp. L21]|jgi:Lon protease-like protein|uniref:LON peptidase substrate-binding domain-containing protein n=1 Tax=Acidisphaera sp. L21 TaxID=1641851 RepID=UPI00131DE801|nr:LON peptidase substrate-binding domain-containing protein [Acidisphaera sp. L21]
MEGAQPTLYELPTEFPVFPLTGALLLPHGKLPLNIFEPRYKAMVEDALADQRVFGMIQADEAQPGGESGPGLFGVGCLGRLSSFSETDDGRYLIALTGMIRFDVRSELVGRRGYRRVSADFSRFVVDLDPPGAGLPQRGVLLAALRGYFASNGFDANWQAIEGMDDDDLVVTLCMVCPFGPMEKQALLEAADPAARADTLVALLQMGAHGREGDAGGRKLS